MSRSDTRLPIRTVAAITGVNADTLRAWERRHGLVRPQRTAKGHRLYSEQQVEDIQRVLELVRAGVALGQVRAVLESATPSDATGGASAFGAYAHRMAAAVAAFDESTLERVCDEALASHAIDRVTRLLLIPVLESLRRRRDVADGGVAEERFYAAYLRNKLGARFRHRRLSADGPKLCITGVNGGHDEIDLLVFALAAHDAGMRVVLVGDDLPPRDAVAAARRAQCDGLVLWICGQGALDDFSGGLAALVASLGRPVYVGGASVRRHAIAAAGAVPLGTNVDHAVRRIGAQLRKRATS